MKDFYWQNNNSNNNNSNNNNVDISRQTKERMKFLFSSTSTEPWRKPGSWSSRKWIGVWMRSDLWPASESFQVPISPRFPNRWGEAESSKNFDSFLPKMVWSLLKMENFCAVKTSSNTSGRRRSRSWSTSVWGICPSWRFRWSAETSSIFDPELSTFVRSEEAALRFGSIQIGNFWWYKVQGIWNFYKNIFLTSISFLVL